MNTDVVIIGAGPAGIFTALEMLKKGSRKRILIVEKGKAVEDRHCPKEKTKKCADGGDFTGGPQSPHAERCHPEGKRPL